MVRGRSEGFEEDGVSMLVSRVGMNRSYVKEGRTR